jgi:hypothetical protein
MLETKKQFSCTVQVLESKRGLVTVRIDGRDRNELDNKCDTGLIRLQGEPVDLVGQNITSTEGVTMTLAYDPDDSSSGTPSASA